MDVKFNDNTVYALTKDVIKELKKSYKLALENVNREIERLYTKMGKPITLAQASRYNRLTKTKKNIEADIKALTTKKSKMLQQTLVQQYGESYYQTGWKVQKPLSVDFDFTKLNTPAIVELAQNPIPELTIPNLTKNHMQQLIRAMNTELTQGLIRGVGYIEMARAMAKRLDVDRKKAEMVAWTEGHRVLQKARFDSIEYMENKGLNGKKQWLATLDDRTRPSHAAADGQRVPTDDNFVVGGYQLMYPGDPKGPAAETIRCRCSMIYVVDDKEPLKRRQDGNTLDFTSYKEWKNSL